MRGARKEHVHSRDCDHHLSAADLFWIVLGELEEMKVANQDKLNEVSNRLTSLNDNLNAGVANIRQDIADLKANNADLDFSSLENSVAGLESSVSSVGELADENPTAP